MSTATETETKPEHKETKNATPAKTHESAHDDVTPKPHRKSKWVMLAEGSAGEVSLLSSFDKSSALVNVKFYPGVAKHVVPTDSDEAGAVGEDFAESLVDKKLLVYCDAPDKDAKPAVFIPAPETPVGDMLATGVMVIGAEGTPVLNQFPPQPVTA